MGAPAAAETFLRCQLCTVLLNEKNGDNKQTGRCRDHLHTSAPTKKPAAPASTTGAAAPPPFSAAEVSLIATIGVHLPATELLKLLNDRRVADRGPGVALVTLEHLQRQVQTLRSTSADGGWSAQRRFLAKARASGVLQLLTPQVIDDFAIVFRLSAAQVTHLRDVVASATEE
jgi:hypothetical protein